MAEPSDLAALEELERLLEEIPEDRAYNPSGQWAYEPYKDGSVGFVRDPTGYDVGTIWRNGLFVWDADEGKAVVALMNAAPDLLRLARVGLAAEAVVTPVGYRTMTPEERAAWVEWLEARGVIPTADRPESKGGAA